MTVRDNLIAARALIDTPEKWVNGALQSGNCRCAVGAALDATDYLSGWEAVNALAKQLPSPFHHVPTFNDHPDTTHADILALFDRAIAACTTEQVAA
jgi:hypothetical protein